VKPKTAVVLFNLGGPIDGEEVKPFLSRLFSDKEIVDLPFQKILAPTIVGLRHNRVRQLYHEIGGGSPIKHWTNKQGHAMVQKLDAISPETAPHKYYISFRYANPMTDDALLQMKADGVTRAVAFTQYPQYSCTTTRGSFNELWRGLKRLNLEKNFEWSVIDRWPTHPGFIKAVAQRVREGLHSFPEEERSKAVILFSAHSLPMKIVLRGDPYPQEVSSTVHEVMDELKYCNPYISTWQSAVGPNWLGPQTVDVVKLLAKRGVKSILVVPIAFTSDHIETLSEIDIEVAKVAKDAGIANFRRAPSLNDSELFTTAMADIVASHLAAKQVHTPQYKLRCPGCTNSHCRNLVNPITNHQHERI